MFLIGSHLSVTKGYLAMGKQAAAIGANTFQFFTRNPRGGKAKALNPEDIAAFLRFARENGIGHLLCHASYTLNPAAPAGHMRDWMRETMADDLLRMESLPGNMYNFHPGYGAADMDVSVEATAETLNTILKPKQRTLVLLETMPGKKGEVGGTFEQLRAVIDKVELKKHVGVCLDTCHVYDAGYDIVTDLDGVLGHFDRVVGLERLRAIHLNDSKNPFESHKDRHAKLGEGSIGLEAFGRIINHPALRDLPFYLETPNDVDGYAAEIALLKTLRKGD